MMSWFPTESAKVPDWSPKVWQFAVQEVYSYSDETEVESNDDADDIDYDQVNLQVSLK